MWLVARYAPLTSAGVLTRPAGHRRRRLAIVFSNGERERKDLGFVDARSAGILNEGEQHRQQKQKDNKLDE